MDASYFRFLRDTHSDRHLRNQSGNAGIVCAERGQYRRYSECNGDADDTDAYRQYHIAENGMFLCQLFLYLRYGGGESAGMAAGKIQIPAGVSVSGGVDSDSVYVCHYTDS